MSKPEEGVSLTDASISDESIRLYLETRYPKEMSEGPNVVIHPADQSVYDEVRERQQLVVTQREQAGDSTKMRGFRWRRITRRRTY